MNLAQTTLLSAVLALAATGPAQAQSRAPHSTAHASERAALAGSEDPFAPVYIITSRKTYASGLQTIARNPLARRDSIGSELVVARISAHQLTDVSEFIHEKERRCGGYFAFDTLAEADAFLRADRTQLAQTTQFLASYTIDNQATVNPWLPQVAELNIRNTISHLSTAYPNRYYASTHGKNSATWIRDNWLALANGRSDVTAELFSCATCSTQPSVILTIQGTELPGEIVVLGGHLDSISNSGSGETMNAPGADDDASGIASLTEVLRIAMASGWKPKRTVKFMGYAAEEVGLRGSAAIASSFKSQGVNVVGVLQLDMTNYRSGSPHDMQLMTDFSNATLQQFLRDLFDTYLLPLGMSRGTYTCGYACSDHASWTSNGFPAAFMYEGGDFPFLHTTSDNLGQMGNNATPSVALAKLGLAFLGELGKTSTTVVGAPVADFSFSTTALVASFTDASSDPNGSIVSRSWNFGDGTTSTTTNPTKTYAAAGSYNVTLTVTDNSGLTASRTRVVAVEQAPAGSPLSNGVSVTGLSATAGNSLYYTLQVPANSTSLKFAMNSGTGNADLYVRFGSAPTDTSFDCRPFRAGNLETCNIAVAQAGTYHVRIKARTSFSGVKLTGSYTAGGSGGGGGGQTYTNSTPTAVPDNGTVESSIVVSGRTGNASSTTLVSVNISHPRRGDLRIRLVAPDGSLYVIKPSSATDSAPNVVGNYSVNASSEVLNGTWKLRVTDIATGNIGTINSWSVNF